MRTRHFPTLLLPLSLILACGAPADHEGVSEPHRAPAGSPVLAAATWNDPGANRVDTPDSRVIVHLFEWRWEDVARECESFLGPMGYDAVQLSPAAENSVVEGRPWWERYQPASYILDNRSGGRDELADMVRRCNAAGVQVYADVILNHMTGVYSGVGTAGSGFGEYDYPGIWGYDDFHHCDLTPDGRMSDDRDPVQVRGCMLLDLADLATEENHVRERLAWHLNDLLSLGIDGFRFDAARHVAPEDVEAIVARLDRPAFIYSEVIDPDPPAWSAPYFPFGIVTEFQYSREVGAVFTEGPLARLHGQGSVFETVPFLPSGEALVFVDNHDNQRGHGATGLVVTHRDGALYDLATVFLLAQPYGVTRVMSSYEFATDRDGPPTAPGTESIARVHRDGGVDCGEGRWVCEHRRAAIAPMVRFRSVAAGAPLDQWWTDGGNQVAFSRGDRGFVALNRDEAAVLSATVPTGLPAGTYCNILDGHLEGGGCTGTTIVVSGEGSVALEVPPMRAVATHAEARVGS